MTLDQMQQQWQQLETRVEALETRPAKRLKKVSLYSSPAFDILFGILINAFAGEYLFRNAELIRSAPMSLLPMALLLATGIGLIATAARQFHLLSGFGLAKSPLQNWEALTAVRTLRVKTFACLMAVWVPFWFLVPVAFLQSLGAHSILEKLNPGWMIANVFVGAAMFAVAAWAAKKWLPSSSITTLLTGAALNQAIEDAKAVKRFATDLS